MQIVEHWLAADSAAHKPCENYDDRPQEDDISLLVIHCISLPPGEFSTPYIDQLFANRLKADEHPYFKKIYQLRVSTHAMINRTGEISQYVGFNKRAWHAGQSEYQGRCKCNDFSIGIELEGTESIDYTDAQYRQLAILIATLLSHYPGLSRDRITGHSEIAPDRKKDPGESFDWNRLFSLLPAN
jgi:AmpD protein